MKNINKKPKTNFCVFLLVLMFLLIFFPLRVLALSADPQQHFTSGSLSNWAIGSCNGDYTIALNNPAPAGLGPADPFPGESAQNAVVDSGTTALSCPVTITYTDQTPTGTQNYIKIDVYTKSVARSFLIYATDGSAAVSQTAGSSDVLQNCSLSSPVSQSTTAPAGTWETLFLDTHTLGPITEVQIIVTDNNTMGTVTGYVLLDNLRGDALITCLTPTPTPTPTNTSTNTPTATPTDTPISSYTFTNTVTQTVTNTATTTVTQTPTQTGTNTATNTATHTVTNTDTNTPTNTPLYTFTFTQTPTNTSTNTTTLTPFITNTPTITPTFTPAPCQPEVYPNPMDFTAAHNEVNVPASACPTGKCIVFSCVPFGSTVKIYTVSLALVRSFDSTAVTPAGTLPSNVGLVAWDGTNGSGGYTASGLYFYVVNGPGINTFGKFAISRSLYGP
ncbi:MAG TPA: hypothetical protein VK791_01000 [bacterium]|jgi:hypothetical protein|nr:hypothetical protein [bacterium]